MQIDCIFVVFITFAAEQWAAFTLYAYSLLCIFAEFNDRRQGRTEDRRRGDRSREPSRERYYDPYDYNEYYRAAAYARGLYLL